MLRISFVCFQLPPPQLAVTSKAKQLLAAVAAVTHDKRQNWVLQHFCTSL